MIGHGRQPEPDPAAGEVLGEAVAPFRVGGLQQVPDPQLDIELLVAVPALDDRGEPVAEADQPQLPEQGLAIADGQPADGVAGRRPPADRPKAAVEQHPTRQRGGRAGQGEQRLLVVAAEPSQPRVDPAGAVDHDAAGEADFDGLVHA
jgi:hypothetical protein